jgi:protein arginine kinase activator
MSHQLCQSCKKNAATVHLTEIVEGVKREVHYCEACAQTEGLSPLSPQIYFPNLVGPVAGGSEVEPDLKCPECGLTYAEFRQRGRLGCGADYDLFREGLNQLLERIHGSNQHIGKIPQSEGDNLKLEREIIELKRELKRAIHMEDYEQAARIRDRIRKTEEKHARGTD